VEVEGERCAVAGAVLGHRHLDRAPARDADHLPRESLGQADERGRGESGRREGQDSEEHGSAPRRRRPFHRHEG
jgi:hypothetical protein